LVDPSSTVRRIMTSLIERDGYRVIAFAHGHEALACLASEADARVLITSSHPDGISGVELCAAACKLIGADRALYVIMMSSTHDRHLIIKALDNGADDFIHKPPDPEELRAKMRVADRVTTMKQELIRYATTDCLTGLLNRRAFFARAREACERAATGRPLAAILFDVDHFKTINDRYGHDMRDRVLIAIGGETKTINGVASRLGGEEFGVLVENELAEAVDVANDLQKQIRTLRFRCADEKFNITCSFGVSEWETGDDIDKLLRRCDVALYEAKNLGRDRIVASDTFVLTKKHDEWRGTTRSRRHC